jgi:hypothetical protein
VCKVYICLTIFLRYVVMSCMQVVSGFDVLQTLSSLPYARPRDSWYDKPYFELGESLGTVPALWSPALNAEVPCCDVE